MIRMRVKPGTGYQKDIVFINPKCGHVNEFTYSAPFTCQEVGCTEKVPDVDKLYGDTNRDRRVRYFAECKI